MFPAFPSRPGATLLLMAAMAASGLTACGDAEGPSDVERAAEATRQAAAVRIARLHAEEVEAWREERLARLQRPDGWLSLVGLHWLQYGDSIVGSGPTRGVRLAVGPDELGMITLDKDGTVRFRARAGAGVTYDGKPSGTAVRTLATDADGATPTVVGFNGGDASFIAIRRGDRVGLRVRDAMASTRTGFTGIDHFPVDRAWRFVARVETHPAGRTLPIVNVLGQEEAMPNPGAVVFERDGITHRLEAVDEGDGRLFLIFADRTSGHETYAAARFLYAEAPGAAGTTVVDFNKAYNPPCAFTPFSTCPLPPPSNRLDLRVEAGEWKPRKPGPAE